MSESTYDKFPNKDLLAHEEAKMTVTEWLAKNHDLHLDDREFDALLDAIGSGAHARATRSPAPGTVPAWVRVDMVFSGEGPDMTFVEAEDETGKSLRVGEWDTRPDGLHVLKMRVALPPGPEEDPDA